MKKDSYRFAGINACEERPFAFDFTLAVQMLPDGLQVHYVTGLKSATTFTIESSEYGSKLTIQENYQHLSQEEFARHGDEVDRSLTTWAGDMQKFLITWKQWRWLGPWRWYMRHVWQRLKPSGRRITYMFWWITLVEITLIVLGVGIYLVEYR